MRRKKDKVPAREDIVQCNVTSIKASDYGIKQACDAQVTHVVAATRISREQPNPDSLDDQLFHEIIKETSERGFKIVKVISRVGPAYDTADDQSWSEWIKKCVGIAKLHNAAILFRSTERAIRTKHDPTRKTWNQSPSTEEFERFRKLMDGVEVLTAFDPDLPPDSKEVKQQRKVRNLKAGGSRGGRPKFKRYVTEKNYRTRIPAIVSELSRANESLREIERQTGIPFNTIKVWKDKGWI